MNTAGIEKNLEKSLGVYFGRGELKDISHYALFPTGKLFRAKLVLAVAQDYGQRPTKNHHLFATAIEYHHTYTLIHDDLPCMDNDFNRRGRASVHRKFNEWKALLAGNSLLNASYRALGEIQHPQAQTILKIFSHALGPKGLLLGQFQDLSNTANLTKDEMFRIHEYKTARLIQCALVGSYLLCDSTSYRQALHLMKLGKAVGATFQLLDDLIDVLQLHSRSAGSDKNPWPHFYQDCCKKYNSSLSLIPQYTKQTGHLMGVLKQTFNQLAKPIKQNSVALERALQKDLKPLLALL